MPRDSEPQTENHETRRCVRQVLEVALTEKRLNRRGAATYVTETYGFRLSPRTLEYAPIPYIVVNGQAIYQKTELDKWADAKIANASRRIGRNAQSRGAAAA
jgi:hypothetical protein